MSPSSEIPEESLLGDRDPPLSCFLFPQLLRPILSFQLSSWKAGRGNISTNSIIALLTTKGVHGVALI